MGFFTNNYHAAPNRFSFVSLAISLAGRSFTEISGISYNDTLNRSFIYGHSPYPVGRLRGSYAAGASLQILKEEHINLLNFLGQRWATKEFDIVCSYIEPPQPQSTDQLIACSFSSKKDAWKYSADPLYVEADLTVVKIIRNGLNPF